MMSSISGSLAYAMGNAYSTSLKLHGEIGLSREYLLTRFQSVINTHVGGEASGEASLEFFRKLHTADLYLATACVLQSNAAWCRLATLYSNHVNRISKQVSNTSGGADEIAGNVMGYLYMPDGSGRTRIASYSGCGSLASWVGAVVRNLARDQNLEKHRGFDSLESTPDPPDHRECPESRLRSHEYSRLISTALLEACDKLSDRERRLLEQRYRHQLQITRIAQDGNVAPSSITRQFERIHKKLYKAMTGSLASRHRLSVKAIEHCIREMMDNPALYVPPMFEEREELQVS